LNLLPVPVALRVLVQRSEHDGQDNLDVVTNKIAEVFVIPKVQSSLGYLEVGTCDGFRKLVEERLLDLCEFRRVHNLKNIFDLVQKHDLLSAIDLRPVS
jgi:hypothetical protein